MEGFEKPQIIVHVEKGLNYTVYDVKWIPCSAKLVVLGSHPRDTGALQIFELSKGELKLLSEVRCVVRVGCSLVISSSRSLALNQSEKKVSFRCGTFGAANLHQRRLATGNFAGQLQIWSVVRV